MITVYLLVGAGILLLVVGYLLMLTKNRNHASDLLALGTILLVCSIFRGCWVENYTTYKDVPGSEESASGAKR